MCLACCHKINVIKGKENIAEIFDLSPLVEFFKKESGKDVTEEQIKGLSQFTGNILHTHLGERINLNREQLQEIIDNALAVIATGVDTQVDIWSVQWANDYVVKTIKA